MRKSFIIHNDSLAVLDDLTIDQCGELFMAIRAYQIGELVELSPIVKIAFSPFRNQFDRDSIKYENTCKARAEAGSRGGKQKVANASKSKQKQANVADSVSKNKNKNNNKEILIPSGINESAWNEWINYRKSKKKTVSQAAAKKQFKLLSNHVFEVQQQIIDQSIQNDYQGLFEPKGKANDQLNQSGQNSTGHRLSAVGRVKANAEQRTRERELRGTARQVVAEDGGDVRVQVHEPVRGDSGRGRDVGLVLDGDYRETNG